jgi:hypothetical protein
MNRTFDYNGVQIAPSKPVQKLRTVKKTLYLDSGDRDTLKFDKNGDCVLYLPRAYEKVVSLNIRAAEFPPIDSANAHGYGTPAASNNVALTTTPLYILVEIEGLNKSDETSSGADRAGYVDSVFTKFQVPALRTDAILYTESSGQKNVVYYQPAISKLDRLHIRTRLHTQKGSKDGAAPDLVDGYIYWTAEYSLTLEIETLENSFDDFSTIETRIGDRSGSGFFGQ